MSLACNYTEIIYNHRTNCNHVHNEDVTRKSGISFVERQKDNWKSPLKELGLQKG